MAVTSITTAAPPTAWALVEARQGVAEKIATAGCGRVRWVLATGAPDNPPELSSATSRTARQRARRSVLRPPARGDDQVGHVAEPLLECRLVDRLPSPSAGESLQESPDRGHNAGHGDNAVISTVSAFRPTPRFTRVAAHV